MDKKDYKVTLNEKNNTVIIEVKVELKPKHVGVKYYDTSTVIKELKKLGHDVKESNHVRRSKPVRSDDGERSKSGVWEFKLPQKKVKPKASPAKAPAKTPTIKKKTTSVKKTSRKTTKNVVE